MGIYRDVVYTYIDIYIYMGHVGPDLGFGDNSWLRPCSVDRAVLEVA